MWRHCATSPDAPARAAHDVVALGITNQRETTVIFDRETGELPHRAIVWQDRRTAAYCERSRRARRDTLSPVDDGARARFVLLGDEDALVPRSRYL